MKRVAVLSDTHCLHHYGLAHPDWWAPRALLGGRVRKHQRMLWNWFTKAVAEMGAVDALVINGDAIDGDGWRSQGSEEISTDRLEQVGAAELVFREIAYSRCHVVAGTAYHTGSTEDFERVLASRLGGTFHDHLRLRVNGLTFDFSHHSGRSSIPYGMNDVAKQRMWDVLNREAHDGESARVFVRSHVHNFRYTGTAHWLAIQTPCLQWPGSKYGRRCSGPYEMGFLVFDIEDSGEYDWHWEIARLDIEGREAWVE